MPRKGLRAQHGLGGVRVAAMACALIGLAAAGLALASGRRLPDGLRPEVSWPALAELAGRASAAATALVAEASEREPAALAAVAGAAAVPVLAILAALLRGAARARTRSRMREPAGAAPVPHPAWPRPVAWLELERGGRPAILDGELARIGRSEECDLALRDTALADTHAIIQRTPAAEYFIFDVSAIAGAGVAVNGRRLVRGRLADGDCIELGASRIIFRQPVRTDGGGMVSFAGGGPPA